MKGHWCCWYCCGVWSVYFWVRLWLYVCARFWWLPEKSESWAHFYGPHQADLKAIETKRTEKKMRKKGAFQSLTFFAGSHQNKGRKQF